MKITHRQNKNYTYDHNGSVIRGDIIISKEEFEQFVKYLKRQWKRKTPYFYNDLVQERIGKPYGTKNNCYSLGTTANHVLAEKSGFKLPKPINYQIIVK
jgi:hypothetical protein